ncbi:dihydrofolate reductase family protein [Dactylosporangium sp. AC04546]|uniref:RibD family protein n=1 Tax=Dactylosporangium sp. AC04546 TaxID=2862460 RepID=UPI001EDFB02E|nr:dihydrofolate reductase family protein [Dactylosporangium sp. AC04546]WVK79687.1 dihydrofolate reductase family protein [Dactylosporangium sp. AC04546]
MSELPRVVVSVVAGVDGRVALSRGERLLDADADRRWRSGWPGDVEELLEAASSAVEERYRPTVVLEGSGTFVGDDAPAAACDEDDTPAEVLLADYLPKRTPKWFAVVDGRGRVDWSFFGDAQTSLLVLVCESTPLPYLARLRRDGVPYLVAGQARVDLRVALLRLREALGAQCVVSHAGGGLNGALLRAGLVDEVHVVTVPMLVGGLCTPSVADGPPLPVGGTPVRLRTVDVTVGAQGTVWAHYEVIDARG